MERLKDKSLLAADYISEKIYYREEKEMESMEDLKVTIKNPMTYDRLHTLSMEYDLSKEILINLAVERLLDDVEFVRKLRSGAIKQR